SVKGRLERGRNQLRQRLQKRGLLLPAVLGGTLLLVEPARAVPPALAETTLNAVRTGAGATPAAAILAREVMLSMQFHRMKAFAAMLLAVRGTGLGLAGLQLAAQEKPAPRSPDKGSLAAAPDLEKSKSADSEPLPPGAILRLGTLQQRAVGA